MNDINQLLEIITELGGHAGIGEILTYYCKDHKIVDWPEFQHVVREVLNDNPDKVFCCDGVYYLKDKSDSDLRSRVSGMSYTQLMALAALVEEAIDRKHQKTREDDVRRLRNAIDSCLFDSYAYSEHAIKLFKTMKEQIDSLFGTEFGTGDESDDE